MRDLDNIIKTDYLLLTDLRHIINDARVRVASTANYELSMMYWRIGNRINRDILDNQRAEYGKQIVPTVSTQLQAEFGSKGFEEKNIRRMMKFAQKYPDEQFVASLMRQLSWTHILQQLDKAGIKVAKYMTEFPPKEVLMKQIRKSLAIAKARGLESKYKEE